MELSPLIDEFSSLLLRVVSMNPLMLSLVLDFNLLGGLPFSLEDSSCRFCTIYELPSLLFKTLAILVWFPALK